MSLKMLYTLGCFAFWTLSFAFHPITVPNRALLGHVYRSLQDLDWLNCIQSCHDDPYCFSYNFVPTKHGLGVCQMIDCGLEDLCNTEGLVFSAGAIFQRIAATEGTEICESSPNTRGSRADFSLLFPSPGSIANYVQGGGSIINLSELSVCFWVKSSKERFTVFSYIGIRGAKELALEIYDRNYVTLTIGDEQRTINVKVNDRKWHHVCVVWANSDGQWAFFKDGVVVRSHTDYKTQYYILPGGSLVLGQEQFSDKTFDSGRSFQGEMTNFNLWSRYLTAIEISRMSKSCLSGRGDVFKWSRFRGGLKGEVKAVRPSSCDH